MRQAGRYLAEYRRIREQYSFLTLCKTPELAAEVTLQPVNRLGVDAAIIFADILLPLEPMGIDLEFAAGEGPVIHNTVQDQTDVDALQVFDAEQELPFVMEAIRIARRELAGKLPLIGFSGAPFTLASYVIEGGHSQNYIATKLLMYHTPHVWHQLMGKLAEVVARYLHAQIRAGVQVVQLFDSWVGCLTPNDYREYVLPHSQYIFTTLKDLGVPTIHFGTDSAGLLAMMREAGGDVIGVDWRIQLDDAWRLLGEEVGIQGNLDPLALFAPIPEIEKRVADILHRAAGRPGHIFNLGHGILPKTPVEHVQATVEIVHRLSQKT